MELCILMLKSRAAYLKDVITDIHRASNITSTQGMEFQLNDLEWVTYKSNID